MGKEKAKLRDKMRVTTALSGGIPDMVPVGAFYNCDYLANLAGITKEKYVFGDNSTRYAGMKAGIERHDTDMFYCNRGISRRWSETHHLEWEDGGVFAVDECSGDRDEIIKDLTLASTRNRGLEPGCDYGYNRTSLERPLDEIRTVADLKYIRVRDADELIEDGLFEPIRGLVEEYGDRVFFTWGGWDGLLTPIMFFGWEKGLTSVYDQPEMLKGLIEIEFQQASEGLKAGATTGIPGVERYMAEASVLSPRVYDDYVADYDRRFVDLAHQLGLKCIVRLSAGQVAPMLSKVMEAGYDAVKLSYRDRLRSPIDIGEVRKQVGPTFPLFGNLSPIDHLLQGSAEEVEAEVRRQIKAAGREGAFILFSFVVPVEVSTDQVDIMIAATRKHGKYPIS